MLEEYKDVFPEELPKGLPPRRSVEMKIELETNAKPKMGPIYKLSKKEISNILKNLIDLEENRLERYSKTP